MKINIQQFINRKKQAISGLTPEHAIYDNKGERLDNKLNKLINNIDDIIKSYLDSHPELIVKVQDKSIDIPKLAKDVIDWFDLLQTNIDNEADKARFNEQNNTEKINIETNRAKTAENTLQTNINNETNRAKAIELAIQKTIDNIVKTGEASSASNVTLQPISNIEASNVQDAISEIVNDSSKIKTNTEGLEGNNIQDNLNELVKKDNYKDDKVSYLEREIGEIKEKINVIDIENLEKFEGYIFRNDGTWQNGAKSSHSIIKLPAGLYSKLDITPTYPSAARIAFLKSYNGYGNIYEFASGFSLADMTITPQQQIIDVPSDAEYLYIARYEYEADRTPSSIILRSSGEIENHIADNKKNINTLQTNVEKLNNVVKEISPIIFEDNEKTFVATGSIYNNNRIASIDAVKYVGKDIIVSAGEVISEGSLDTSGYAFQFKKTDGTIIKNLRLGNAGGTLEYNIPSDCKTIEVYCVLSNGVESPVGVEYTFNDIVVKRKYKDANKEVEELRKELFSRIEDVDYSKLDSKTGAIHIDGTYISDASFHHVVIPIDWFTDIDVYAPEITTVVAMLKSYDESTGRGEYVDGYTFQDFKIINGNRKSFKVTVDAKYLFIDTMCGETNRTPEVTLKSIGRISLLEERVDKSSPLHGKTMLAIGDSLTAARVWQYKAGEILGMNVITHAEGGIGAIQMVDGYYAEVKEDSDHETGVGSTHIQPLSVEDVTAVDLIVVYGFYNDKRIALNNKGSVEDMYQKNVSNTFLGRLNYVVKKIYSLLEQADNLGCRIVFSTPHRTGKNPYTDVTAYENGDEFVSAIREAANYNSIPLIDVMHNVNINKYTWSVFAACPTYYNPNYIPNGSKDGTNRPFASVSELPSSAVNGNIATVGTTNSFTIYRYNGSSWVVYTDQKYPWLGDQVHLNADGYNKCGEYVAAQLKSIY